MKDLNYDERLHRLFVKRLCTFSIEKVQRRFTERLVYYLVYVLLQPRRPDDTICTLMVNWSTGKREVRPLPPHTL